MIIITPTSSGWAMRHPAIRALPFLAEVLKRPDAPCNSCSKERPTSYQAFFASVKSVAGTAQERLLLKALASAAGVDLPTRCKILNGPETLILGDTL